MSETRKIPGTSPLRSSAARGGASVCVAGGEGLQTRARHLVMDCEFMSEDRAQTRPYRSSSSFTTHRSLPTIILVAAFQLSLLSAARSGQAAENSVRFEASHESMGTIFTIAAYGRDRAFLSEVVEQAFEEVDRIDEQMSNYKQESELSAINREAASHPVVVEPRLFHLLEISLGRSKETGGAFDITVGPLMKAWGFFRGRGRLPSQAEIGQILKGVGYQHIKLDPEHRTIRFDVKGVEIDLGGIAKGYAVDRAADVLRANGITTALVSSGMSSIYALGSPPGEQGGRLHFAIPIIRTRRGMLSTCKTIQFQFRETTKSSLRSRVRTIAILWTRILAGRLRACFRQPSWLRQGRIPTDVPRVSL